MNNEFFIRCNDINVIYNKIRLVFPNDMEFNLSVTHSDTKMRCSKYSFRILEIIFAINSLDKALTELFEFFISFTLEN